MESSSLVCPLATTLAQQLRDSREELTRAWLDRIAARVALDPNEIFPTHELLDHVPLLVSGIADYMESAAAEVTADVPVVAKARELGELRHAQGFDTYEILKEFEILGGVLFAFLTRVVDTIDEPCARSDLLTCAHRLFRAVEIIQQSTTMHFLTLVHQQMHEREERLRAFNRMVSHELKNRVGAIQGAHEMLGESFLSDEQRGRFLRMIGENADGIRALLENLLSLSRVETESRQQRNVLLPRAAAEAARQLRELARARGVRVRIGELPPIEVNAAAVELCLTNYISNAIKYSDPGKTDRWVEVSGRLRGSDCEIEVEVRDNGVGIPVGARDKLFERFYRAHEGTVTGVEGTGLGLSIVRETVRALGGDAWVTSDGTTGSSFFFSLPCRRRSDAARDRQGA